MGKIPKIAAAIGAAAISASALAQTGCPLPDPVAASERMLFAPARYETQFTASDLPVVENALLASQHARLGFIVARLQPDPVLEKLVGRKDILAATKTRFGDTWCWWTSKGETLPEPPLCLIDRNADGTFKNIISDRGGKDVKLTPSAKGLAVELLPLTAGDTQNGAVQIDRRVVIGVVTADHAILRVSYDISIVGQGKRAITLQSEEQSIALSPGATATVAGLSVQVAQAKDGWTIKASGTMLDWARVDCRGVLSVGKPVAKTAS